MGRPSKYSEAYCQEVISFMAQGFSVTAFAGEIGVNRDTVYEWARVHPDFSDSLTKAHAKRMRWWEERLCNMAQTGTGNAASIIFALKNLQPEDWRDKLEVANTQTVTHTFDLDSLPEGDINALASVFERLSQAKVKPSGRVN